MMVFQMIAVGGDSWTSPFGAVATMYEVSLCITCCRDVLAAALSSISLLLSCYHQDPFGDTQKTDDFASSCYVMNRNADHPVHPYFLRKAYGLGERITNVTVAWKNSSYVRWG
jgi:hypothetical protein